MDGSQLLFLSCPLIQLKHPRLGFHFSSLYLKDLREDDEGMFSILDNSDGYTDILKLVILGKVILVLLFHYKFISSRNIDATVSHYCIQFLSVQAECAQEVTKYYGDEYIFDVPREADILEFASIYTKRNVKVVWNRSSAQTHQKRVKISWSTARIRDLTQVDNGYYNLRKKDSTLIWRRLLTVKGD